jgi:hypothetical protein
LKPNSNPHKFWEDEKKTEEPKVEQPREAPKVEAPKVEEKAASPAPSSGSFISTRDSPRASVSLVC